MENEQYEPQEMQTAAAQEAQARIETEETENKEHNWFYYAFGNFIGEVTEDLEKALVRLKSEEKKISRADFVSFHFLHSAIYKVGLELLMRKNPEFRELAEKLGAVGRRKYELQRAWEKEILAREGEEGLKRRNQNGEGPGRQYTREELDLEVAYTKARVDAGILRPSALKHAIEERDAGGFYQWDKERKRKNDERGIRALMAVNDPEVATVIQNIFRLNEEDYGREYAEKTNAHLIELAGIAPPKEHLTPSDDTTG